MLSLSRAAGAVVWFLMICCRWFKAQFIDPVADWWVETILGSSEESVKSVVRELFAVVTRVVNGLSAWLVSAFVHKGYYRSLRTNWNGSVAWQSWWSNESTFNAIIAREREGDESPVANGDARQHNGNGSAHSQPSSSGWLRMPRWPSKPAAKTLATEKTGGMHRSASDLFERQAGWAVAEANKQRGFLEDLQLTFEVAITTVFDFTRWLVRSVLLMPPSLRSGGRGRRRPSKPRAQGSAADGLGGGKAGAAQTALRRSASASALGPTDGCWTTADVIRAAGYPLEQHTVVTDDGYVLEMERIPRHGTRDVVFFLHGIMDTSLGWVSNGVTGSQAFAAYDQGLDVWLGNSRSNPPRKHIDPARQRGGRYWFYTINELALQDVGAQVQCIHDTKTAELGPHGGGAGAARRALMHMQTSRQLVTPRERAARLQRSLSDSVLLQLGEAEAAAARSHEEPPASAAGEAGRMPVLAAGGDAHASPPAHVPRQSRPKGHALATVSLPPTDKGGALPGKGVGTRGAPLASSSGLELQPSWEALAASGGGGLSPMAPAVRGGSPAGPPPRSCSASRSSSSGGAEDFCSPVASPRSLTPSGSSSDADASTPRSPWGHKRDSSGASANVDVGGGGGSAVMVPDKCAADGREVPVEGEAASFASPAPELMERLQPAAARGAPLDDALAGEAPYRLRAVGHSLGGAMLLMYTVVARLQGRPHRLDRLVLLTPAGFIKTYPLLALPFLALLPMLVRLLALLRPRTGGPAFIPSSLLRYITFKLTVDLQQLPALNELVVAGIRLVLKQDPSAWDAAMRMPHYNTRSMPALSFHVGAHLCQWVFTRAFRLYDYGSPAANRTAYGSAAPPDVGANYALLDLPVDLVAGTADGIVERDNVLLHYKTMRDAGCHVTYKEFDYGHLDFTFANKEDLRRYVLSRLLVKH